MHMGLLSSKTDGSLYGFWFSRPPLLKQSLGNLACHAPLAWNRSHEPINSVVSSSGGFTPLTWETDEGPYMMRQTVGAQVNVEECMSSKS